MWITLRFDNLWLFSWRLPSFRTGVVCLPDTFTQLYSKYTYTNHIRYRSVADFSSMFPFFDVERTTCSLHIFGKFCYYAILFGLAVLGAEAG